ncbi:protein sprouty homolog 3 [Macrosteles quadrilineatus]|uniref:protein sprouty homolog 3 n=1 Tax=Macrosteles quadrilineatus TaxID=74068 RepID=UPI0023E2AEC7|nr:protein sprouty homolog 3 [Macrosteles quadrilineatus]XP_054268916.1 protein sprouty homolog 3 [Macrosteles quadrilineatus]
MADRDGTRGGLVSVHNTGRPSPPDTPPGPVTLLQPRPDQQRAVNEYVETPLRPTRTSSASSVPRVKRDRGVVTEQPGQTFKKDSAGTAATTTTPPPNSDCSIICRECGRCRCESCREPRPMPSLWLCHDFCLCSTETCVDYGSCLCCVKGLMYHCASKDGDDDTCADDPCSCGPHRRLGRWTCLGLTSLVLPCLCCYWPLRGVAGVVESLYSRCTSRGCRCDSRHSSFTPEKRLLDSSPEL